VHPKKCNADREDERLRRPITAMQKQNRKLKHTKMILRPEVTPELQ
jgi:hypothetical protein